MNSVFTLFSMPFLSVLCPTLVNVCCDNFALIFLFPMWDVSFTARQPNREWHIIVLHYGGHGEGRGSGAKAHCLKHGLIYLSECLSDTVGSLLKGGKHNLD